MKINEIRVYEEVPAQFVATHYGGPFGLSRIMLHSDGKLYHKTQQGIQPWQGNPNNKISPAYIKGTLVNGNKVPYPQGTTFATAPKAAAPAASAAANTATPTNGTLRKGSKGEAVKKLQYDLGVQPADGVFGPSTEAAVKDFQQRMMPGETADGIVGPKTNTAIQQSAAIDTGDNPEIEKSDPNSQFAALSGFATSRRGGIANNPSQVDAIKELQAELERRGYYKGAIDGKYGPGTREAVKAFQSKFDLFVDGDAGPKTIQALMQRDGSITQTTLDDPQDQDASGQDGRNTAAGAIGPVGANAVDAEKTTDGGRVQQGPYQEGNEITDELQGQMEQAGITDLGMVGETITQEDAIALNRAWQNGEIDGPESAAVEPGTGADGPAGGAKAPTETPPAASTLEVLEPQPRGYGMDQGKVIIKRGDTYYTVDVSKERTGATTGKKVYRGSSLRGYTYDASNPQAPGATNADAVYFPVSAFENVTTGGAATEPEASGNVEPRPKKNMFGGDIGQRRWDKKYGKTHNPDGTPKTENITTNNGSPTVDGIAPDDEQGDVGIVVYWEGIKYTIDRFMTNGKYMGAPEGKSRKIGVIDPDLIASIEAEIAKRANNESKEHNMNNLKEANMNISVNGDSAAEVAELLRIMQLAGAPSAKPVDIGDINQGPKPCSICGEVHTGMPMPGGCGSKSVEPDMGSMIKMISGADAPTEEEDMDGGFGDATTEPDEYTSSNAGDVSDMIPSGDDLHKSKKSYPATAGGDNPMNVESSIKAILLKALAEKKHNKRPDSPDLDGDGDTEEPIAQAAKQAKKNKTDESIVERDVPSNFENKHKDINNLGRKMMDMSSKMSGTDDTSLMMANALSRLGEVLAEFGGNGFAANNMNDVIKKSALNKEIVQMLMKKAKAA
jgi:peptidoglycan hydrolase-like protein with peptidoglycan-binding domain